MVREWGEKKTNDKKRKHHFLSVHGRQSLVGTVQQGTRVPVVVERGGGRGGGLSSRKKPRSREIHGNQANSNSTITLSTRVGSFSFVHPV
jgi:hypothetical protein